MVRSAISRDLGEDLLSPSEVAVIFHVDAKTVGRWRKRGFLKYVKTPGGRHLYPAGQFKQTIEDIEKGGIVDE